MEEHRESDHLVRALLERHRRSATKEQDISSPGDSGANWAASKDFTADVGKEQIGSYIRSWRLPPRWLCALDYSHRTERDYFAFYHYRARFSRPTPQEPIPATASVYFVVGVSKVRARTEPVEVLYAVESGRRAHTPGHGAFREKWLVDVIESKALLRAELDF